MIKLEQYIPNFLTACNLFCGFAGILFVFQGYLALGAFMVFAGGLFDLTDGITARLFNAYSDIGKQLDSLADIITFGTLPAIITFKMILQTRESWIYGVYIGPVPFWALIPVLLTLAAAFRLARFNENTNKQIGFRGMPTPAVGLLFASLPLIVEFDIWNITDYILNARYLVILSIVFAFLMVSPFHFFDLKITRLWHRSSIIPLLFAGTSLILAAVFWFAAVPIIILIYILFSIADKMITPHEVSSEY